MLFDTHTVAPAALRLGNAAISSCRTPLGLVC